MLALEIKELSFKYDKNSAKNVLNNVSFVVNQGEYVSLIGHNGSGKSTLSRLIIGLLAPDSGSIKVFDEELTEKSVSSIRNKVGIVFQNPDNQFIGATVEDDIAFGLENKCVDPRLMQDIINKYAKEVDMIEFIKKEPSALSGGQKQRVAIASTLALGNDILVLDEATSMLDPRGKEEIISLIHRIKKENPKLTIVSITHDVEEASLSDRVIVLNKGEIMYSASPEEVFSHEDELIKIGLDIPFYKKLKKALLKEEIDVEMCNSEKEIGDKLCQ